MSNELVHQVDLFSTLLHWAGADVPADREVDGMDQRAFLAGETGRSARNGCIVWVRDRVHAVKWRNFKVTSVRQRYFRDAPEEVAYADVVNLTVDPKEREPYTAGLLHTWVPWHTNRMLAEFEESVQREPLIPARVSVDHMPGAVAS